VRIAPPILLAVLLLAGSARGADTADGLHGRIELRLAGETDPADALAARYGQSRADAYANLRLTYDAHKGPWAVDVAGVFETEAGPDVQLAGLTDGFVPPAAWAPLTRDLWSARRSVGRLNIDRLALSWSNSAWVVRLGRQTVTWDQSQVFRPMDLFSPFGPTALDTEYKPGADMVYVQHLFASGADVQFVFVPRPDRRSGPAVESASSEAVYLRARLFGRRTGWMLAHDHGDWVGAFTTDGALGGAAWSVSVVPTGLASGGTRVSLVADITDATRLFGRNLVLFGEYHHNGFGVGSGPFTYAQMPADLAGRLARGQVFALRRDYLSGGGQWEATPLTRLNLSLIVNLTDGGVLALGGLERSLSDNLILDLGVQVPAGPRGSEYGGVPLTPGLSTVVRPATRAYFQLKRYF
jgi:hypothetical protein